MSTIQTRTHHFVHHMGPKGDRQVDLYYHEGARWPHGFELTAEHTTNISGPFATGSLYIREDGELLDFDGVFDLPLAVRAVLQGLGVTFDEFVAVESDP